MAAAADSWAPPESDFLPGPSSAWAPPESDFITPAAADSTAVKVPPGLAGYVGQAETLAHLASGALAPFAGGLTYLGTLGLTFDTDAAKAVKDSVEDQLTYQPRTETGQRYTGAIGRAAQATIGRATDYLSDKAADVGGPVAGATARTALEGGPYLLGLGPEMSLARGAVGAVERGASALSRTGRAFDTAGSAIPPVSPTVAPGPSPVPDVPGAAAASPPIFEAAPPENAPESPLTAGPLPPDVQARRAATLRSVGLTEARDSAITGDKKAAATDYQQSKVDDEAGKVFSDAFDNERATLNAHADRLIADAGGSTGLDETSLHNRGQTILQPLADLSDHLDARISDLYKTADAAAQGMPLQLASTAKTLANRPAFIGTVDGQQLLRGANAYLRQAGVMDEAGTLGEATVQQAERFKQYLNEQWSPRTARLIRGLKDAIDDDVTQSAGKDVYEQARAARTLRANLLDNPTGVASLLDSSGPNGINRTVNIERVPDTVARMPVDQFGHIVDTLKSMPAEMRPQAQAALNEIRSQFALRMLEQAQRFKDGWNPRGVTQYLNNNSAKMARVFSPSELQRFRALNDAGNILDVNRAYPGAAVQGHNLAARIAIGAIRHGAAGAGAHLGGPIGAIAGEAAGGMAAKALGGSMSKRAARARIRKL